VGPDREHELPAAAGLTTYVCKAHDSIVHRMGILLQVRDLPEDVHRTLKARAAAAGVSLSEYVRAELGRVAERPTVDELAARVRARGEVELSPPSEQLVRELRDSGE
jgi:antitoxin FitA